MTTWTPSASALEDRECEGLRPATGIMISLAIAVLLDLVLAGVVITLITVL